MPSRWICWWIIAFWLATMGYVFYKEVWPLFLMDNAPPYSIDLMDEARQKDHTDILWRVFFDEGDKGKEQKKEAATDKPVYTATTSVSYREKPDDTFAFHLEFLPYKGRYKVFPIGILEIREMKSFYRVNREGQLVEMEAIFDFSIGKIKLGDFHLVLNGHVEKEMFLSSYRLVTPLLEKEMEQKLPPLKMSYHGSVLQPMHPVNRIRNLKPGQSWRMPVINPVRDALQASQLMTQGEIQIEYVTARVDSKIQNLPDCDVVIPCYVIDYEDEGQMKPRTWVQVSTGLVMRQESTPIPGHRLVMQRKYLNEESR